MTMLKTRLLFAVLVYVSMASVAQATPWTITASGIITGGTPTDDAGIFGISGASLLGLSYTQAITTDPVLNTYGIGGYLSESYTYGGSGYFNGCCGAPYTLTTTVNGVTYTQTEVAPNQNSFDIGDSLSINDVANTFPNRLVDSVFQEVKSSGCYPATGPCTDAIIQAFSYSTPFVPSLNFNQPLAVSSGLDPASNSYFHLTDASGRVTGFSGTIYSLSINPSAVPEPSSLALLSIGLAGLGFFRYRRV